MMVGKLYAGKLRGSDLFSARKRIIAMAETPIDFLEAYYLSYHDKVLEEIFFVKIGTVDFSSDQWKFLLDNSSKFGLLGLKTYVESILR